MLADNNLLSSEHLTMEASNKSINVTCGTKINGYE